MGRQDTDINKMSAVCTMLFHTVLSTAKLIMSTPTRLPNSKFTSVLPQQQQFHKQLYIFKAHARDTQKLSFSHSKLILFDTHFYRASRCRHTHAGLFFGARVIFTRRANVTGTHSLGFNCARLRHLKSGFVIHFGHRLVSHSSISTTQPQ